MHLKALLFSVVCFCENTAQKRHITEPLFESNRPTDAPSALQCKAALDPLSPSKCSQIVSYRSVREINLEIKRKLERHTDALDNRLEDVILRLAANERGPEEKWVLKMKTIEAHDWYTTLCPFIHDNDCVRFRWDGYDVLICCAVIVISKNYFNFSVCHSFVDAHRTSNASATEAAFLSTGSYFGHDIW